MDFGTTPEPNLGGNVQEVDLPEVLAGVFTEDFREVVIKSLSRAYSTAIDLHDEARGSNEMTFGLGVYTFGVHELSEAALVGAPFRVTKLKPLFRMAINDYILCCHRVGQSASENIWSSFPGNEQVATRMIEEQLWLEGMKPSDSIEKARNFVIAHFGNPETGLEAVYICIPKKVSTQNVEWAHAFCIWKRSIEEDTLDLGTVAPLIAPEEQIPDNTHLRKKAKEETI